MRSTRESFLFAIKTGCFLILHLDFASTFMETLGGTAWKYLNLKNENTNPKYKPDKRLLGLWIETPKVFRPFEVTDPD